MWWVGRGWGKRSCRWVAREWVEMGWGGVVRVDVVLGGNEYIFLRVWPGCHGKRKR